MLSVRRVVAFLALSLPALQSSVAGILSTPSVTQTPVTQAPVTVMEFYHAGLDHYFITADTAEAGALDAGIHPGWIRTGYQFTTYSPGSAGTVNSVCRFYGRPDAGLDSHFYTGSLDECTAVLRRFSSSWALESGNVFRVQLPDLATGACPSGTSPVFRLFNNRSDANHRYTIDVSVKNAMVSRGYTSEGYGTEGVVFCAIGAAPSTPPAP